MSSNASPSKNRIHLIRHGATEWSTVGRFAGVTDLPLLTDAEPSTLARRASLPLDSISSVFASPLQRARQTATLLLGSEEFHVDDRLRERDYGDFEGLTTRQIREIHPGWNVWQDDVPNGEPMAALTARVDSFLAHLQQLQADGDGDILVVSHAHWIRLFTARWLGLPAMQAALFRLDTLGVSVLGWERENPVMLGWGA
jgi:broad specificity phosphatase PhoE